MWEVSVCKLCFDISTAGDTVVLLCWPAGGGRCGRSVICIMFRYRYRGWHSCVSLLTGRWREVWEVCIMFRYWSCGWHWLLLCWPAGGGRCGKSVLCFYISTTADTAVLLCWPAGGGRSNAIRLLCRRSGGGWRRRGLPLSHLHEEFRQPRTVTTTWPDGLTLTLVRRIHSDWAVWGATLAGAICSACLFNLRPAGGCFNTPPCGFFADSKKTAARSAAGFSPTLSPIFLATFVKVSILCHARSDHQVRSSDHTLQKTLQSRPSYSVWGKVMKLSEYDKVISTYKMYYLGFLISVTLGQVIFVTSPLKSMGKN